MGAKQKMMSVWTWHENNGMAMGVLIGLDSSAF